MQEIPFMKQVICDKLPAKNLSGGGVFAEIK